MSHPGAPMQSFFNRKSLVQPKKRIHMVGDGARVGLAFQAEATEEIIKEKETGLAA